MTAMRRPGHVSALKTPCGRESRSDLDTSAQAPRSQARSDIVRVPRVSGERGSAVVEFVFLGVLLLVPVFYLVATISQLQAASYAVTLASREAGRAFVTAGDDETAGNRARAAAAISYGDFGLTGGTVDIHCSATPCLTPQAEIDVHASVQVTLPLLPSLVADRIPLRVPVDTSYVTTVDRFRG